MPISRRKFLQMMGLASAGLVGSGFLNSCSKKDSHPAKARLLNAEPSQNPPKQGEVMFYEKLDKDRIRCEVCPKYCVVAPGNRGTCGNKENKNGCYYSLVHGAVVARNVDPIEKKPFFHFLPGTTAFSLATAGCNFNCHYCQNWQISQCTPEEAKGVEQWPPERVVKFCLDNKIPSIAFTYSEPVVFYEYMYDIAKLARQENIATVMVSNGYINEKPLRQLCEQLTAVKIDLKSFSETFYRKTCNGQLTPVLEILTLLKKIGIWFEIVVLIIPTLNDGADEIRKMCQWIKDNLGNDIPLHFSRFTPQYKMRNLPPTPLVTLEKAHNIALETGLQFVYLGNVPLHQAESTYCPNCQKILIKRVGYDTNITGLKEGSCTNCRAKIPGVWAIKKS